jgi:hypothetical protein
MGFALAPGKPHAAQNLLRNADFSKGSGDAPDHWRTGGWIQTPGTTIFAWIHKPGAPAMLMVDNRLSNDARWVQSLTLAPGWYHMSAEIRADPVSPYLIGANISILEDSIMSADVRGTTGWRPVGFYLEVGKKGADVDLALRVGFFLNLTKGRAFFRNASVVKVAGPPPGAVHVYDLDAIRERSQPKPIGKPWTLVAVFVALSIAAAIGWRMFGEAEMQAAHGTVRSERRRKSRR